jgi:hypothetical protein
VNLRRWAIELDDVPVQVELEHRTWWERAIIRIDGVVVRSQSINLAIGYSHGTDLDVEVAGHWLTVEIRATGLLWATYRYGLRVDGAAAGGGDELPRLSTIAPTPMTFIEHILVGGLFTGVGAGVATGRLLEAGVLVAAALLGSGILRRGSLPATLRLVSLAGILMAAFLAIGFMHGTVGGSPRF